MAADSHTDTDTDDPRLTGDRVRRLSGAGEAGDVTLVGVVHDHPASAYRVGRVVGAADPDVLALELPPLAVSLYEEYADDGRTPPRFGGEMSAAVQAAGAARVVGIDGPSPGFAVRLLRTLAAGDPSASTVRSVLRSLASVSRRAVACRLAAALAARADLRVEVGTPTAHDCDASDDPADQAESEDAQIRRARTVTETFGRSDTTRVRTRAREGHMADRLATLRRRGDAVAVVGVAHLDPLAERLARGARP